MSGLTKFRNKIRLGMDVDFHSIIGGPITKHNCKVESYPWQLGDGTWVVLISDVSGAVDIAAITSKKYYEGM